MLISIFNLKILKNFKLPSMKLFTINQKLVTMNAI